MTTGSPQRSIDGTPGGNEQPLTTEPLTTSIELSLVERGLLQVIDGKLLSHAPAAGQASQQRQRIRAAAPRKVERLEDARCCESDGGLYLRVVEGGGVGGGGEEGGQGGFT